MYTLAFAIFLPAGASLMIGQWLFLSFFADRICSRCPGSLHELISDSRRGCFGGWNHQKVFRYSFHFSILLEVSWIKLELGGIFPHGTLNLVHQIPPRFLLRFLCWSGVLRRSLQQNAEALPQKSHWISNLPGLGQVSQFQRNVSGNPGGDGRGGTRFFFPSVFATRSIGIFRIRIRIPDFFLVFFNLFFRSISLNQKTCRKNLATWCSQANIPFLLRIDPVSIGKGLQVPSWVIDSLNDGIDDHLLIHYPGQVEVAGKVIQKHSDFYFILPSPQWDFIHFKTQDSSCPLAWIWPSRSPLKSSFKSLELLAG